MNQAAVYFGENLGAYVVVDTDRDEVDYLKEDGTTQTDALQRQRWREHGLVLPPGRVRACASATSTR